MSHEKEKNELNMESFLNRLESRLEKIVDNNIEKYEFFRDVLLDLIYLIPNAEKGTVWEYRGDKKVCIAQYGYNDEFIEKLVFEKEYDELFNKDFEQQIIETKIQNTLDSKISRAPIEMKELIWKYVPSKEFITLLGTIRYEDRNRYEIYLDNFAHKHYTPQEIRIFSTYLKLVELFLKEYSLKHELRMKNKKVEALINSMPIGFAEFDENFNLIYANQNIKKEFSKFFTDNKFDFFDIHKKHMPKIHKVLNSAYENKVISVDFYLEENNKRKYYNALLIPLDFESKRSFYVFIQDLTLKYRERETFINSLEALARILATMAEYYTQDTQEHIERMRNYSETFCKILRIKNEAYFIGIKLGAMLHDIGKFKIDPHILNKPGALTREEYEYIKMHVNYGVELLQPFESYISRIEKHSFKKLLYKVVRNIVLYHHENYDGTGYLGLKKLQIPFEARLVHIIDVYDALTHKRVYKESYPPEKAIEIILSEKEKYDPMLLEIFIKNKESFPP